MNKKLKVGVFSFTSCAGCEMTLINEDELFGKLADDIDLCHLPLIQERNKGGPYDCVFIEGAVTTKKQERDIKELRKKTRFLIAFGTCATFGGINALRDIKADFRKTKEHDEFSFLEHLDVKGIGDYVKVDYFLKGCPPTKEEFLSVIGAAKKKKMPQEYDKSVCIECREKKNRCLLATRQCLGPVTCGGCRALCTTKGMACYGCRGPVSKANTDVLINTFKKRGISDREISEMFLTFAGTSKRFDAVRESWQRR